jgi:hypothetical protein
MTGSSMMTLVEHLPDVRRGDQGGGGAVPLLRPSLRPGVTL